MRNYNRRNFKYNINNEVNSEDRNCQNSNLMEQLKSEIQACGFKLIELALYLDTHPNDMRAVCMHNECAKKYRKLTDEYQKVYGPLTNMFPCNSWRWLEEPWPWERSNNMMQYNRKQNVNEENNSNECDFDLKGGIR